MQDKGEIAMICAHPYYDNNDTMFTRVGMMGIVKIAPYIEADGSVWLACMDTDGVKERWPMQMVVIEYKRDMK